MESTVPGLTVAEIAEKYGRPARTIEQWRQAYDWPAPSGTREGTGRPLEYDPDAVDAAVRAILALADDDANPDELLTAEQAAADLGISYGTIRGYISRGKWPGPDSTDDRGVRRWTRRTVRAKRASMRPRKGRRAQG